MFLKYGCEKPNPKKNSEVQSKSRNKRYAEYIIGSVTHRDKCTNKTLIGKLNLYSSFKR